MRASLVTDLSAWRGLSTNSPRLSRRLEYQPRGDALWPPGMAAMPKHTVGAALLNVRILSIGQRNSREGWLMTLYALSGYFSLR